MFANKNLYYALYSLDLMVQTNSDPVSTRLLIRLPYHKPRSDLASASLGLTDYQLSHF